MKSNCMNKRVKNSKGIRSIQVMKRQLDINVHLDEYNEIDMFL